MSFSLGKPIATMIALACVAGVGVLFRPTPRRADLEVWVFAEAHARTYRSASVIDRQRLAPFLPALAVAGTLLDAGLRGPTLLELFRSRHGVGVDVKLVNYNALNIRLNSLFDRGASAEGMPDLVEIEIGTVGRYFRPPLDLVGFLPLNDYLAASPYRDQILESRLKTWSKGGQIFGIPHDVHPVSITYRKDLFDEAGIDLAACDTWPRFHEACVQFQKYWRSHGVKDRWAIDLSASSAELIVMMLMQQRVSLVDSEGVSHLTDPRVAKTVAFYAQMVAGPRNIATGPSNPGVANRWCVDMQDGYLCASLTADWKASYLPTFAPGASGKMAMMPLPKFHPSDAPTASWGGTMIGIPRHSKNPDLAWKLIELIYLSDEGMAARKEQALIVPPVRTAWKDPLWHEPFPYFGGQKIGELYISLAEQMPPVEVSPFRGVAQQELTFVMGLAIEEVKAGRLAGLETRIAAWLVEADADLNRRMDFGKFD